MLSRNQPLRIVFIPGALMPLLPPNRTYGCEGIHPRGDHLPIEASLPPPRDSGLSAKIETPHIPATPKSAQASSAPVCQGIVPPYRNYGVPAFRPTVLIKQPRELQNLYRAPPKMNQEHRGLNRGRQTASVKSVLNSSNWGAVYINRPKTLPNYAPVSTNTELKYEPKRCDSGDGAANP